MSTTVSPKEQAAAKKAAAKKADADKADAKKADAKTAAAKKANRRADNGSGRGSGRSDSDNDGAGKGRRSSKGTRADRRTSGRAMVRGTRAAKRAAAAKPTKMSAAAMKSGTVTRVSTTDAEQSGRARFASRVGFGNRTGGTAPFVPPKNRLGRRMRMRELGRRGFVQLSPGKQKLRHRILPRTVIGIAAMLMAVGVGAAFSGAAFYAYYDNRLAENERTVARFVEGFDQQFTDAAGALDEVRTESVSTIRSELGPLSDYVSDARGVINLPASAGPSVWLVETRDEAGKVGHGSAFAIVGHRGGTALVTSYQVVIASASAPSPGIELVKGNSRIPAELWSWDEERDLALLVVDQQIPILQMAGNNAQLDSVGGRVFAMSGYGGQGATASPGVLLDHSPIGLQHTAPLATFFNGGPLLNSEGQVLGMASNSYNPFELEPGQVHMAPDVRGICVEILQCSEVDEPVVDNNDGLDGESAEQTDGIVIQVPAEDGN